MLDALTGRFLGADVERTDDTGCSYMSHLCHDVGGTLTSLKDCSVVLSYEMIVLCGSTLAQSWFSARPHTNLLTCVVIVPCLKGSWLPLVSLWLGFLIHCPQARDVPILLSSAGLRSTLAQFLGPSASGILRVEEGGREACNFLCLYIMTPESECY